MDEYEEELIAIIQEGKLNRSDNYISYSFMSEWDSAFEVRELKDLNWFELDIGNQSNSLCVVYRTQLRKIIIYEHGDIYLLKCRSFSDFKGAIKCIRKNSQDLAVKSLIASTEKILVV